jgi:hypothetical protein
MIAQFSFRIALSRRACSSRRRGGYVGQEGYRARFVHDCVGRRQHLSARMREPARHPSQSRERCHLRVPNTDVGEEVKAVVQVAPGCQLAAVSRTVGTSCIVSPITRIRCTLEGLVSGRSRAARLTVRAVPAGVGVDPVDNSQQRADPRSDRIVARATEVSRQAAIALTWRRIVRGWISPSRTSPKCSDTPTEFY